MEHRDGTAEYKLAPLKKSIYSLSDLRQLMLASNRRYLEFISTIDDPTCGTKILEKISQKERDAHRTYKGLPLLLRRGPQRPNLAEPEPNRQSAVRYQQSAQILKT